MQDTRTIRNGGVIYHTTYGTRGHSISLCHSNNAVDAINKTWNEYYVKQYSKTRILNDVNGAEYILYVGVKMLSYKTHQQRLFQKLSTIYSATLD